MSTELSAHRILVGPMPRVNFEHCLSLNGFQTMLAAFQGWGRGSSNVSGLKLCGLWISGFGC